MPTWESNQKSVPIERGSYPAVATVVEEEEEGEDNR
jgi:hypothetical protein